MRKALTMLQFLTPWEIEWVVNYINVVNPIETYPPQIKFCPYPTFVCETNIMWCNQ